MKKVAVGLSGGVDSAVAALLLKQQGYEVVGVHLYCWPPKSEVERDGISRAEWIKKNGCRADEDEQMALKTALELDIPFKKLDFSEEYNRKVVDYFYREYEMGRTPNPDVLCNSEIKFGLFLDWAMENGFDYVATGHYANLVGSRYTKNVLDRRPSSTSADPLRAIFVGTSASKMARQDFGAFSTYEYRLCIPKDKHKDQTYFLWKLTQKELGKVLFPLGGLLKSEVRELAREAKLTVAERKDSVGMCFVGNVEAREFLARRLQKKIGQVVDVNGEKVGEHDGVWFYTIGERGGWRMDPRVQKKYMRDGETPVFYVKAKNAQRNELVVGTDSEVIANKFKISDENWLGENQRFDTVRIRHGGELLKANRDGKWIILDKSIRGIASGQSAVFYSKDEELLGGGVIE